MKYYLGIDIGASSGRHILAHLENGKMCMEEIYRFSNQMNMVNGQLCWDTSYLFREILEGMKKCNHIGKIPVSVGIDTWAVDFVLLDKEDQIVGNTVGYRDLRTQDMDLEVYRIISEADLYKRTGIQKQIFNTIYQLMAVKQKCGDQLQQAESLLMIPDYLHFLLSGRKACEYTNATTTQLVSPITRQWDHQLISMLGFPEHIFQKIKSPGTTIGELLPEIQKEVGFNCKVVLPATHDTGSAVLAVPTNEADSIYISSGTWSLMGIEQMEADCTERSRLLNFTNEGGFQYRYRFLKNIMGLWMIQSVKKEIGDKLTFQEICDLARKESITALVDCYDERFLAPANMTQEIRKACEETGEQIPEGIGQVACVIYHSLAHCYAKTVGEIEDITGKEFSTIHVVGGGSNADYLNELTAQYTGKKVIAGPSEATGIGNIMVQMMADHVFQDLTEVRELVKSSFVLREFNNREVVL